MKVRTSSSYQTRENKNDGSVFDIAPEQGDNKNRIQDDMVMYMLK